MTKKLKEERDKVMKQKKCKCGHTKYFHHKGISCNKCECKKFEEVGG